PGRGTIWRVGDTDTRDMSWSARTELAELQIADTPARWAALGFALEDAQVEIGGVTIQLGAPGRGITGWTLRNAPRAVTEIDGLRTSAAADPPARPPTPPPRAPAAAPPT